MRNRIVCLFIVLIIPYTLVSCYRVSSVYRSGKSDLYAIANFSVPFITGNPEWDELDVIEVDNYGRILYKYKSFNTALKEYGGSYVCALLICQNSDENYAYYYENRSFIMSDKGQDFSEERINELKIWNDWDKEIENDNLTKISNSFGPYDEYASYDSSVLADSISLYFRDESLSYVIDLVAIDENMKYFFAVREFIESEGNIEYKDIYFIITNEDLSVSSANNILLVPNIINCQSVMQDIKSMNDWSTDMYLSTP